mmetsp:Transcript_20077/g.37327  ORF Transcript_20077/g.37327 Transcript_20077/m.37327 type:complete len:294 (-) Transcript_20077:66-947(-)
MFWGKINQASPPSLCDEEDDREELYEDDFSEEDFTEGDTETTQESSKGSTQFFQGNQSCTSLAGDPSVDDFLQRSGPKLSKVADLGVAGLEALKREQAQLCQSERKLQSKIATCLNPAQVRSKVGSKRISKLKPVPKIDPKTLEQAFSYSLSMDLSSKLPMKNRAPDASPYALANSQDTPPKKFKAPLKSRGKAPAKIPKLKSSVASTRTKARPKRIRRKERRGASFDVSSTLLQDEGASTTAQLDVNGLVENFQNGTLLSKLRKQLEESKASLNESNEFIEAATQQWFASGR